VVIHHDRDSVYTSYAWLEELLLKERTQVSYAERGARDNPWIESFWGRFETENGELIFEAEKTLEEVKRIVVEQLESTTTASEDTRRLPTEGPTR
jgi:hypothetical protein